MKLPADPTAFLQELHARHAGRREGKRRELRELDDGADPFAIALATVDGQVHAVGDDERLFSLQSISKPLVYGLALDRFGRQAVHRKVSVEPTAEAFNSIVELEEDHLPYNPMINSGAIAMSAMLHHDAPAEASGRLLEGFGAYLGRAAAMHPAIRPEDLQGGHRNLAIAHLLRHYEVIGDDVDGALELYALQCAVGCNVRELALVGATLARGGEHPVTGARCVQREHVRDILTLMFTCGMYDSAGTWAYTVGLPAKSGIAGGILAVVPGRMGLAVYSPALDDHGHSVRGMAVLRDWSEAWGLSLFET